jgi:diaphanous 2
VQVLTENLLQSLIQYIPAPDQLNRLKEYEKDYDSLAEAEQFAISISGIKRLVPRLKSLMFKQRYKELVQVRTWVPRQFINVTFCQCGILSM